VAFKPNIRRLSGVLVYLWLFLQKSLRLRTQAAGALLQLQYALPTNRGLFY
jgi:hypothetical protein